ncbi:uncharacterized protein [Pagrus major]|uniref:uncharacterized protein n=1 Tax=Pagrus major TaxID=143350 RepID=UPI003CC88C78
MAKRWSATSLVAIALLGCLFGTEVEAQGWTKSGTKGSPPPQVPQSREPAVPQPQPEPQYPNTPKVYPQPQPVPQPQPQPQYPNTPQVRPVPQPQPQYPNTPKVYPQPQPVPQPQPQYPNTPQVRPVPQPQPQPQYPNTPKVYPQPQPVPQPQPQPKYPNTPKVYPQPQPVPQPQPQYPNTPQVRPVPQPQPQPQYPNMPKVYPKPQPVPQPQYPNTPQVRPVPQPQPQPQYPNTPQVRPVPQPQPQPQYPQPSHDQSQLQPKYPETPQVRPWPQPQPVPQPQYPNTPKVYPQPQPVPQPQYPNTPKVYPQPQPVPQPQYPNTPKVYPQPQPVPQPQYPNTPKVYPQPQPQPKYPNTPKVYPQPQPVPQPQPQPKYPNTPKVYPQPQPVPQPQPQPKYPNTPKVYPQPQPVPRPRPQPQPQTKYPSTPKVQPRPALKFPQYPQAPKFGGYPRAFPDSLQEPQAPKQFEPERTSPPVFPGPAQSCDVTESQRVPCGAFDISAYECEAISCCFDGRRCYFGKAVTVQCTKDAQFIVVVARDATLPNIDLESISLLGQGPSCTHVDSNSEFAIYQFPVTGCGSVVTEEPGVIIYQNRMSSSFEVGVGPLGAITRDSSYDLLFQCRYTGISVETVVVEVLPLQDPPLPVAALGPIDVYLRLGNGQCSTKGCNEVNAAYTSYYTDSDYPVGYVLRDPVYVEVFILDRTDPNLVLTLGRCWTTTSPNPHSLPQWDLLIDGCPYRDDRYLSQLVPVDASSGLDFPSHFRRFIFKMFTFVDNSMEPLREQVYIHCSTAVCSAAPGRNCEPSCYRKAKRAVKEELQETAEPKAVVSVGPVIMGRPE